MLRRHDLVATVAGWARCTEDLLFSRRGNPGNYGQLNISSLMFRREPVIQTLGCWDSVRFGADTEFFNRLKAAFGHNAVLEMPQAILSLGRLTSGSLTGDSAFGYPGFPMGARRAYRDAYLAHHGRSPGHPYRGLASRRPFPVPAPMWPVREGTGGTRNFDVVIAADLRNAESTALVQDDIPALTRLGYKVALVNTPAYDFEPASARPNDHILSLVDGDRVQMVVYGETVAGLSWLSIRVSSKIARITCQELKAPRSTLCFRLARISVRYPRCASRISRDTSDTVAFGTACTPTRGAA